MSERIEPLYIHEPPDDTLPSPVQDAIESIRRFCQKPPGWANFRQRAALERFESHLYEERDELLLEVADMISWAQPRDYPATDEIVELITATEIGACVCLDLDYFAHDEEYVDVLSTDCALVRCEMLLVYVTDRCYAAEALRADHARRIVRLVSDVLSEVRGELKKGSAE